MSAFTEKCWRSAGKDVVDPVELESLFRELERLRGESSRWPDERKKAAGELEREEFESNRLRIVLKQSQDRVRELEAAAALSDVSRAELQRYKLREELHVQPLLSAVTGYIAFAGTAEAETPEGLLQRVDRVVAYKVAGGGAPVDPTAELERGRAEADQLRRAVAAAEARIRSNEREVTELAQLRAANKALLKAVETWERSVTVEGNA